MGLKDLFKRKPKVVEPTKEEKKEMLLTEVITELRRLGYSDEQIQKKFEEKNYPKEFVDYLLKLNNKQEVKQMAKEKVEDLEEESEFEDDEETSDEEEEEDSEDTEDEDLDEEVVEKKKKTTATPKVEKKSKEESKPELTLETVGHVLQTVIQNQNDLAQRLQSIEATLYRMRSA